MPETLGGIPLHPLIVHAVVVLVPLSALCVLAASLSGRFRRWAGLMVPLLATAALITVPLATSTGESLEERVAESAAVARHAELGDQLLPWAIGLAVVAWILWWLGRTQSTPTTTSRRWPRPSTWGVAVLALVAVGGTGVQTYRIGHSGASAVWSNTGNSQSNK